MKQSKRHLNPAHIINLQSLLSLATPIGTLISHTLITIGIVRLLCSLPIRPAYSIFVPIIRRLEAINA